MNQSYLASLDLAPDYTGNGMSVQDEAKIYFSNEYPGVEHLESTDQFKYRGIIFDYFRAARRFGPEIGSKNNHLSGIYLLIDPDYNRNWLFSYGDKEERWSDFLKEYNGLRKSREKPTKSWFANLFWL